MVRNNSVKPCRILEYCPYGPLVEQFPLPDEDNERSCSVFGHECPVFYVAELYKEKGIPKQKEIDAHFEELLSE